MPGNRKPTGKPRGRPLKHRPTINYPQLEPDAPKPPRPPRPLQRLERVIYPLPDQRNVRAVALIDAIHNDGYVSLTVCYVLDEEGHEGEWLGYKTCVEQSLLKRAA